MGVFSMITVLPNKLGQFFKGYAVNVKKFAADISDQLQAEYDKATRLGQASYAKNLAQISGALDTWLTEGGKVLSNKIGDISAAVVSTGDVLDAEPLAREVVADIEDFISTMRAITVVNLPTVSGENKGAIDDAAIAAGKEILTNLHVRGVKIFTDLAGELPLAVSDADLRNDWMSNDLYKKVEQLMGGQENIYNTNIRTGAAALFEQLSEFDASLKALNGDVSALGAALGAVEAAGMGAKRNFEVKKSRPRA